MEWKEEFSIGVPEIDAHHQTLAGCIAIIEEAVTRQERWSAVHSALVRLSDFARIHFAVEESLLRIHVYPELDRHIREHVGFADDLRALQEKSLRADVSGEMVAFIQKWLHEHIMTSDRHYADWLPKAGIAASTRLKLAQG